MAGRFDKAANSDAPHERSLDSTDAPTHAPTSVPGHVTNPTGTTTGGIPHDIPLEYWCEQYQQAFEAKLSYDAVLSDIINPNTLRSLEQAIPNSEFHTDRHAGLYQLVGQASLVLNRHETSDRRDLKHGSQRTASVIKAVSYDAPPAGKRKIHEVTLSFDPSGNKILTRNS